MPKRTMILALTLLLGAGVATSALDAQDSHYDGMMGSQGMMGMMGMMRQMSQMMDHCSRMMSDDSRGGSRPNDQWRKDGPSGSKG